MIARRKLWFAAYALAACALAACRVPGEPTFPTPVAPDGPDGPGATERPDLPDSPVAPDAPDRPDAPTQPPRITWSKLASPDDVPRAAPPPGTFRVHMIDVGTGLAILVQGHDWNLLYDGGTGDPSEKPLRVVAYLAAAIGPSGDALCVEPGASVPRVRLRLDHVVLSHPHLDHGSALDLVLHCYDVANVWDSGRINDAVFYREFLFAVARSTTAAYRTAASVPDDRRVHVKGADIEIARWERFSEGDTIELGAAARFTILHAEAKKTRDPNQNSIVIVVELAGARLLLVGDAESGRRADPTAPVGDIEKFLLSHHVERIRADILQVGHHGSKTSSRRAFVEAVQPRLALVSAGPKRYHSVVLPDAEVLAELRRIGAEILRTDEHDASCPLPRRIGGNKGPGGCDTFIITIEPAGR
jgi:competence protein ComEC